MSARFLFVSGADSFLNRMKLFFNWKKEIAFERCRSLDETLMAVDGHSPQVLFLEHSLTPFGSEGIEVVNALRERRSCVRTVLLISDPDVADYYRALEIPVITKPEFLSFYQIIGS